MGVPHCSFATMTDLHGFLNPNDAVAISFWIISISMVAASVFFLMESMAVDKHWKTSLNVGALVTIVAAVHYFYMREFWVIIGTSSILYRYIDWSITVPLQCWPLATLVRLNSRTHGLDSVPACADGFSSCSRSSQVKLVPQHLAQTSMWLLLSAPCVSSSQWVGLSTLWVISSDISWAASRMPL